MSRNYWMHRISYHRELSYPLLEKHNILSYGSSDFSTKEFMEEYTANPRVEVVTAWMEKLWKCTPQNRYCLARFLDMKKGDYVLVPLQGGLFSVYEIETDRAMITSELDLSNVKDWNDNKIFLDDNGIYLNKKNGEDTHLVDLGFFRKVTPIVERVSRKDYADATLTRRMKYRGTTISLNQDTVENAIAKSKEGEPINLYSEILDKNLEDTHSLINENLNPDKFEQLIKWYFNKVGATSVETPSKQDTKEGDADIMATFEPIKTIIYVQAKFHEKDTETNEWAVQQIDNYAGSKESDEDYSTNLWVISNAKGFSDEAKKQAKEQGVILIDGEEFTRMILQAGISGLPL